MGQLEKAKSIMFVSFVVLSSQFSQKPCILGCLSTVNRETTQVNPSAKGSGWRSKGKWRRNMGWSTAVESLAPVFGCCGTVMPIEDIFRVMLVRSSTKYFGQRAQSSSSGWFTHYVLSASRSERQANGARVVSVRCLTKGQPFAGSPKRW